MRLYKVVVLVNVAFAVGLLAAYVWWGPEVSRLRWELDMTGPRAPAAPERPKSFSGVGVFQAVLENGKVLITHDAVPGLMGSMTMGFHPTDPALTTGLTPGDRVRFVLVDVGPEVVLAALRKEPSR